MKDRITKKDGTEYELEWIEETNFDEISSVRQVYAFIFNEEGKIIIVNSAASWRLPGGKPETQDLGIQETLLREVEEEADIEIKNIIPLGYIKATKLKGNKEIEYLLRYIADVSKINPQTKDPAIGIVNNRLFINPKDFLKYCKWRKFGDSIKKKAISKWKKSKEL